MLDMYLTSVLVYMIILYCTCVICETSIREKGWMHNETASGNKLVGLFMVSAVPVLRLAVVVFIFYMATHTKEDFDKWIEEDEEKQNEGR